MRLRYWSQVLRLPPRAALFYLRAVPLARRLDDRFSIISATPPHHLLLLLKLAKGRGHVVEIGTGSGWTAAVFVLADPARTVRTFDPYRFGQRDRYLDLLGPARRRLVEYERPGEETDGLPADFLFIDASHTRDGTIAEFNAWLPHLTTDATVVFHDYEIAGVAAGIAELDLDGQEMNGLYVWEKRD